MLQYAVIASLIQFVLHLVQILDFAIGKRLTHHNRAFSILYAWWDTEGCSCFTNSSLYINPCIWPKVFELWFFSPKDFILLLYSPVFVCLDPMDPFNIVLLSQQWFLDSNSAIQAILTESSSHSRCWHFFHNIDSVVQQCLGLSAFCHTSWWLWWNFPLHM